MEGTLLWDMIVLAAHFGPPDGGERMGERMKDEGGRKTEERGQRTEDGFRSSVSRLPSPVSHQDLPSGVTLQMPGLVVPAVLEAVGAALSIRRGTTTSGIAGCAVVVGHVGVPARQ